MRTCFLGYPTPPWSADGPGHRGTQGCGRRRDRGLGRAVAAALVAEGVEVTICGSDAGRAEAAAADLGVGWTTADLADPAGSGPLRRDGHRTDGWARHPRRQRPRACCGHHRRGGARLLPGGPRPQPARAGADVPRRCPGDAGARSGRIVAITSLGVRQPYPTLALSNTARSGATGFLKTLAREVAADGVTVNSGSPGLHATARVTSVYGDRPPVETIPAGRLGAPEDLGAVVAFLCSAQQLPHRCRRPGRRRGLPGAAVIASCPNATM